MKLSQIFISQTLPKQPSVEVKAIAANAEAASGVEFIKMEMGVPGLPPSAVGVKAEVEALQNGIASLYPDINGLPALKEEASRLSKPLSM